MLFQTTSTSGTAGLQAMESQDHVFHNWFSVMQFRKGRHADELALNGGSHADNGHAGMIPSWGT